MDKVASFTPPPWDITKGAYGALRVGPARLDHPGKARIEYALDHGCHDLLAQRDADARLIHAAHDMLAALKRIKIVMDGIVHPGCRHPDDALSEVEAAIAKAEGGAA
jgi:hypothetical protein